MRQRLYIFCCVSLAIAIGLGALGAHKLEELLTSDQLYAFKTGVFYQIVHAVALLAIANVIAQIKSKSARIGVGFLKVGPLLFSGSIYLLSTSDLLGIGGANKILGPITPIGGLLMISGWVVLAVVFARTKFKS